MGYEDDHSIKNHSSQETPHFKTESNTTAIIEDSWLDVKRWMDESDLSSMSPKLSS